MTIHVSCRTALAALAVVFVPIVASAQPAPATSTPAPAAAPAGTPASPARPRDAVVEALAPVPGGLKPEQVGQRVATTSYSVAVKQAELRAAAAKVDQALVNFFPRVTLTATYTRLSEVENSLGGGGGLVGARNNGPLHTGPCPTDPTQSCVYDSGNLPVAAQPLSFPVILDNYSFVASVAVPVSDYVFRISQGYSAASGAERAKSLEVEASKLQAAADGEVAYYNWIRAKAQVLVAKDAVAQTEAHLVDARRVLAVGLLSPADVLRLEAQLAAAQQVAAEAQAYASIAEEQLRTIMHSESSAELTIGVDLMSHAPPRNTPSLDTLTKRALERRLELRALDETESSLKETVSIAKAGYLPRLDAFADATYANPNPRSFPAKEEFKFTWDVGARATWVLNDIATAAATAAEAKARVATVVQQRAALRDGLRMEVASAYFDLQKASASINAADQGVLAAAESLRVRQELFKVGKATAVDIIDADTEFVRSRLRQIDARIGLFVSEVRLAHATGADVK
jgi:outer membrane protein TolC